MLTKLKYEIYHEGYRGIKKVRALIDLTNFSRRFATANDSIVVAQSFGYTHYWNNDNGLFHLHTVQKLSCVGLGHSSTANLFSPYGAFKNLVDRKGWVGKQMSTPMM